MLCDYLACYSSYQIIHQYLENTQETAQLLASRLAQFCISQRTVPIFVCSSSVACINTSLNLRSNDGCCSLP